MHDKRLRLTLALIFGLLALGGAWLALGSRGDISPVAYAQAPSGAVRYVALGGNDSGDCTNSAAPCRTVQYAVDQAQAGDEIRIATGAYTGVQSRPAPTDYPGATVVTQVVYISETVTLRGGYDTSFATNDPILYPTTLDAQGQGRVLFISGDISPTIEGLLIKSGDATDLSGGNFNNDAGGGVYIYGSTATISNTTLYDNVASRTDDDTGCGGGLYAYNSDVTLRHNLLLSNTADLAGQGYGGGAAFYHGNATLIGNTVRGNIGGTQSSQGGGLHLSLLDTALLSDNLVIGNTAVTNGGWGYPNGYGGGIYVAGTTTATLVSNTVQENIAFATASTSGSGGGGGGIYVSGGVAVSVAGNTIISNTGSTHFEGKGGGIYVASNATTLSDNIIRGNRASLFHRGRGGGLYASGMDTARGNIIADNIASINDLGYGGGVYFLMTATQFNGNTIVGNMASQNNNGDGGGIFVNQYLAGFSLNDNRVLSNTASLHGYGRGGGMILGDTDNLPLDGNIVQGNVASVSNDGDGGGIYLGGSDVTLENILIISNTATMNDSYTGRGGGVFATQCNSRLVNNIIAGNHATTAGSGLWFDGAGYQTALLHTTIADNHSSGQGVYVDGPTLIFTNTIIAGHASVGITATASSVVTTTYTLWHGNGAHTGGEGTFSTSHDIAGDPDPLFVDPAAWDYHLGAGSPAIDTGVDAGVREDIDGDPRPLSSGHDLGADEYSVVAARLVPDSNVVVFLGVTTYTHVLTNAGNYTDTFSLTCNSTHGWAQVTPYTITLGQGMTQTVQLIITVPTDTISGTIDTTVITATSARDSSVCATVTDTATVHVLRIYVPLMLNEQGP